MDNSLCFRGHVKTSLGKCRTCVSEDNLKTYTKYMDTLEGRKKCLLRHAKSRANRNKLEFNLTLDNVEWPEYCPVLGIKLEYFNKDYRKDDSATIDRRTPGEGYTFDNVRIISWRANNLKSDASKEEIIKIIDFLSDPVPKNKQLIEMDSVLLERRRKRLYKCKVRAKQKGFEFNMSEEDIVPLRVCPILGVEIEYLNPVFTDASFSVDRINNEKGYVKGNVIVMSYRANSLKADGTVEEFRKILNYMNT